MTPEQRFEKFISDPDFKKVWLKWDSDRLDYTFIEACRYLRDRSLVGLTLKKEETEELDAHAEFPGCA